MKGRLFIKVNENDNVAIAVNELQAGTKLTDEITTLETIPQGHKIAFKDFNKGDSIVRYNVVLGYALQEIKKGSWINEHMLKLPTPPLLDEMNS